MLGQFDHIVDFPESWEFVIIYGPNGVGKTKLLEAVHALAQLDVAKLATIPFRTLTLQFSDGTSLEAARQLSEDTDIPVRTNGSDAIRLTIRRNNETVAEATIVQDEDDAEFLEWLHSSTWFQVGDELWEDRADGEIANFDELKERYWNRATRITTQTNRHVPEAIREFTHTIDTHLIETQRLLTFARSPRSINPRRNRDRRATVSEYSEDLKRRLGRALAENSRTTQQLDRTFPRRILENPVPGDVDDEAIRVKYQAQNALRDRLAGIAVIGGEADLPLPQRTLKDWERLVLWTSLNDTEVKLSSFSKILNKISLLEEIVNKRFLGKKISVTADDGLSIRAEPDGRALDPESLSSGEQHELILIYNLLFNASPNTTVLLDEPEISLHVAWQQRFLDDMVRIADLSSLRFIIATHAPQIIHKWWERTVQLGPSAED